MTTKRLFLAIALSAIVVQVYLLYTQPPSQIVEAQTTPAPEPAQSVTQIDGPPPNAYYTRFDYDGSNNIIYRGWARAQNKRTEWTIDAGTLVNFVDSGTTGTVNFTNAHNLEAGMIITFENFTGDTDINGTYIIATIVDTDTITVTTANVTDATYNNGGARAYTICARTGDLVWSIQRMTYTGTNLITQKFADGASARFTHAWDSRTTYAYY